jgi:hypothetical protein
MRDANVAVEQTRLLGDWLRGYVGLVPMWRAEYFDQKGAQPQAPALVFTERIATALDQVRAKMGPACARAKVTQLDPETEAKAILIFRHSKHHRCLSWFLPATANWASRLTVSWRWLTGFAGRSDAHFPLLLNPSRMDRMRRNSFAFLNALARWICCRFPSSPAARAIASTVTP